VIDQQVHGDDLVDVRHKAFDQSARMVVEFVWLFLAKIVSFSLGLIRMVLAGYSELYTVQSVLAIIYSSSQSLSDKQCRTINISELHMYLP